MGGSKKSNIHKSAARLLAVQALYPMISQAKSSSDVIPDYLSNYAGMEVDGESMVKPDEDLFRLIVEGVEDNFSDLQAVIEKANEKITKDKEPLLYAVLVAGTYELTNHYDIDIAIIINDYVDVAHSFFDKSEAKLVNAILDKVASPLKSAAVQN